MENPDFLKKKYDLHNTPEVKKAAIRTEKQTGEKVPQAPADQIQNYLNRFKEIIERKDPVGREMGIQALKKMLFEKFVTKFEEIPESWHALNERIMRERGQGGDWDRYSKEQKDTERRKQAEAALADQEASLEQWIDYLASEEASYIPDYIKYWAFRSITDLAEYDKEKAEFPKRSKGTVKMFPDINQDALGYVIDAVIKKQNGENFTFDQFEADLTDDQKESFQKNLTTENFAKLYGWANEQIHPIAKHLLPITEGKWIKYEQDDEDSENYKQLTNSIRGHGTGWCTAGENTAKSQLQSGDFYTYYTLDDDKQPTIPRIAIRMDQGEIAEVRGIAYKQNLDPYMSDVLVKKLDEFPDKEQYLKKDRNMKILTEIDNKSKKGEKLNKEDLGFLYEIDSRIEGFGYDRDPRIEELRQGKSIVEVVKTMYGYDLENPNKEDLIFLYGVEKVIPNSLLDQIRKHRELRNVESDISTIFEVTPEQIAHNTNEISEDTKIYVGSLEPGIFNKFPEAVEHIYTSFPEKEIFTHTLKTDSSINSPEKALEVIKSKNMLRDNNYDTSKWRERSRLSVLDLLNKTEFSQISKTYHLVELTGEQLGVDKNDPPLSKIFARAEEIGLDLCPAEVGPQILLSYKNSGFHMGSWIGMKTITNREGEQYVYHINNQDSNIKGYNEEGLPNLSIAHFLPTYHKWQDRFIFLIKK